MPHPSEVVFAERLRAERTRAGMSQTALAKRLTDTVGYDVDGSSVTRMEKGTRRVRLVEAVVIAGVLGVPLAALLEEVDTLQDRIDEERRELILARDAVAGYEEQLQRARDSVVAIERSLAELEASRSTRGE